MIPLIDLTPESCKKRLGRRRQLQWWVTSYIVVIAVLIAVTAALSIAAQRDRVRVQHLLRQVQLDEDQQRQAAILNRDIDRIESRIARHERLAWPLDIGHVIRIVGNVAPDSVTFTSLSLTPRGKSSRGARRQSSADIAYSVMYVEIAGIAPDDFDVASFVAGLQSHALFSSITVDYARKAQLGEASAREFGVTCEIDLEANYIVEGATP
jgi:hypothetical protein